jgi:hypothetical protein
MESLNRQNKQYVTIKFPSYWQASLFVSKHSTITDMKGGSYSTRTEDEGVELHLTEQTFDEITQVA